MSHAVHAVLGMVLELELLALGRTRCRLGQGQFAQISGQVVAAPQIIHVARGRGLFTGATQITVTRHDNSERNSYLALKKSRVTATLKTQIIPLTN